VLELALDHSLGKLPEPELTRDFFWRAKKKRLNHYVEPRPEEDSTSP
jgi:hypothetical protein